MVRALKTFFKKYLDHSPEFSDEVSEHSLQLATAALLVEMMRADAEIAEDERRAVMK